MDYLNEKYLYEQVSALAGTIGPRPAGSRADMLARQYIRHALSDMGYIDNVTEERVMTPNSWSYALLLPVGAALAGNFLHRWLRWLGASISLGAAYSFYTTITGRKQPILAVVPKSESGTLVVKIAPKGEVKRRVVLIGHTDSNRDRFTFSGKMKRALRPLTLSVLVSLVANGAAQLFGWKGLRGLSTAQLALSFGMFTLDNVGQFVPGANDNASAVACLLGIGGHLSKEPLENTEVWLAFTAAEEVGLLGTHGLLDNHREELADAYFIDFEMVGSGDIAYVTDHSGFTLFGNYQPDDESLALAVETAREHPELGVRGAPVTILEEVAALHSRGFRGLCIVGVGEDGWLENWHQSSDNVANIQPKSLERAARFAWQMIKRLDAKA